MKDEELVKKSRQDIRYFEELIQRYQNPLKIFCMRISSLDKDEAEDALQEIFIKAWRNLESFNEKLKFSSWIYAIARNETINYYKKHREKATKKNLNLSKEDIENIASKADPSKEVKAKMNNEALSSAIANLTQKHKELIILHYFEQKTYEEISDILKIPPGTVSTSLTKARTQLLQKISQINELS